MCASFTMIDLMQTGLELLLNSTDEEFLVAMFFSLSKLASVSTLLITEQVIAFLSLLYNLEFPSGVGRKDLLNMFSEL